MITRPMNFRGDNMTAIESEEPEILLASAAGTGKSMACLAKIAYLASIHEKSRHLIVRKTRSSLTETGLVTLESAILEPNCAMLHPSNMRKVRQSYRHSNGAEIIVGGMDKPDKVLSSEYDTIYVQESTELELEEWETLIGRLRNNRMPYQQIMADCNPTFPHHWLYKRWQAGKIRMYRPTHKDNPRYWITGPDGYGMWSKEGADYLAKLDRLTGFRRKRFLEGVWAAAEGLVFDAYDATVHNLPQSWEPPKEWRRYHSIDFGHTNPMVYQYWAEDGDGRLYLYKERYETKRLVEDLGKQVRDEIATYEPRPQFVVGDHDAEDRATFEKHSGLKIRPADKRVNAGIDMVNSRMVVQKDGKPRIFFRERAVARIDQSLSEAGKPTSLLEELTGYVWCAEKDKPEKENDHACFVAGTMVETEQGPKAIETIQPGDMILTSKGYFPCVYSAETNESAEIWEFITFGGIVLQATGNHPICESSSKRAWCQIKKWHPWMKVIMADGTTQAANLPRKTKRKRPVYNLSVDGPPEYYANGILVHNCDAMRYLVSELDGKKRVLTLGVR